MEINKSTRHSKITGDFSESLVLYWLSKYGFECALVDHTGIDIIANNQNRRGGKVRSGPQRPNKDNGAVFGEQVDEAIQKYFGH